MQLRTDGDTAGYFAGTVDDVQLYRSAANEWSIGADDQLALPNAPTASSHATNKAYVDAIAAGLVDWKESARVVATTNLDLDGGETIDGVVLTDGDRVLATGQTTPAENGIYVVNTGGAWSRSTDADADAEVTAGLYLSVTEGASFADTMWILATNDPIVVDTTALTFIQLPSLNDLVAGNGLVKTATTLDVGAGTGITVNANDVAIDTAVVPRKGVANTFTDVQTVAGLVNTAGNVVNITDVAAAAGTYSATAADEVIHVTGLGGAGHTVELPATPAEGQRFVIKDRDGGSSTNALSITTAGAETIDGAASTSIAGNYDSLTIIAGSDGNYYTH